jgi:hypothetical protein
MLAHRGHRTRINNYSNTLPQSVVKRTPATLFQAVLAMLAVPQSLRRWPLPPPAHLPAPPPNLVLDSRRLLGGFAFPRKWSHLCEAHNRKQYTIDWGGTLLKVCSTGSGMAPALGPMQGLNTCLQDHRVCVLKTLFFNEARQRSLPVHSAGANLFDATPDEEPVVEGVKLLRLWQLVGSGHKAHQRYGQALIAIIKEPLIQ